MNPTSTITLYKFNKQFTSSIDLFDLLEDYYPEKHNTIVRMRNIAYRELINTGVLTADGITSSLDPLYKNILNTCIPTITTFLQLMLFIYGKRVKGIESMLQML